MTEPLYAFLVRFRPAPGAAIREWVRYYPTELYAHCAAAAAVRREYGLQAELVSCALAAVAVKQERYPITEELAAALAAERKLNA